MGQLCEICDQPVVHPDRKHAICLDCIVDLLIKAGAIIKTKHGRFKAVPPKNVRLWLGGEPARKKAKAALAKIKYTAFDEKGTGPKTKQPKPFLKPAARKAMRSALRHMSELEKASRNEGQFIMKPRRKK